MASLLALLTQQKSSLQTRKGLILTGLQQDFLSREGRLPVPLSSNFIDNLQNLVHAFRDFGDVIWVRSQYEADRPVQPIHEAGDNVILDADEEHNISNESGSDDDVEASGSGTRALKSSSNLDAAKEDVDEELFLTRTAEREPCCIEGSDGIEYAAQIRGVIGEQDLHVVKTFYSAFGSTSLLPALRSRLITELFVCGVLTNVSVFATAMDAARYGIKITLVEDCLGYRIKSRHERALRTLQQLMGAEVVSREQVIERLTNPPLSPSTVTTDSQDDHEQHGGKGNTVAGQVFADDDASNALVADSDHDSDDSLLHLARIASLRNRPSDFRQTSKSSRSGLHSSSLRDLTAAMSTMTSHDMTTIRVQKPKYLTRRLCKSSARPSNPRRTSKEAKQDRESPYDPMEKREDEDYDSGTRGDARSRLWVNSNTDSKTMASHSSPVNLLEAIPATTPLSAVARMETTLHAQGPATHYLHAGGTLAGNSLFTPLFGTYQEDASAASRIYHQLLPVEVIDTVFDELKREVAWERMYHQTGEVPRLVACQGTSTEDGCMPVYRHPSDQTLLAHPWTSTVDMIRRLAEDHVGHQLNHGFIQLYRSVADNISEHSDKTLDIHPDSFIVNVSFGAQRTMRFRKKRAPMTCSPSNPLFDDTSLASPHNRNTRFVPLAHNSMLAMSLATNAEYLHGIKADKRPHNERTGAQTAYAGQRISLTFRNIGTFLSKDARFIWGQGATGKSKENAHPVVNGHASESEKLVDSFRRENQASEMDWREIYGQGTDVLHLK